MPEIILGEKLIPYTFKRSSKSKYIRINVYPGEVVVTSPVKVPESEAERFLKSREQWVIKKLGEFEISGIKQYGSYGFNGGEELPFLGRVMSLLVVESDCRRTDVTVSDDRIIVYVNNSLEREARNKEIRSALEKWYIEKARKIILDRLKFFQKKLGVEYNSIRIKNQKTRWGSCSRKKNLNFNWKLLLAPAEIIDYVIVHELCHLRYMNHSDKFWAAVEQVFPSYKEHRKWLRENGRFLTW